MTSRWWMRWYAVRSIPAVPLADLDADEYVEFGTFTARSAMRAIVDEPDMHVVRRKVWLEEHL